MTREGFPGAEGSYPGSEWWLTGDPTIEVNEATGEARRVEDGTEHDSTYDPWLPVGDGTFERNADTGESRLTEGDDDDGSAGVRELRDPKKPSGSDFVYADTPGN